MKELLKALEVALAGTDIHPEDFIHDCVVSIIDDHGYGSLNDFNDLPSLNPEPWDGWDYERDHIDKDMVHQRIKEALA
jgi:hypothetical protein